MGDFVLVASGGHSGTRWLAEILHHPDEGVVFFHEWKNKVMGGWARPWRIEIEQGLSDPAFAPYFGAVKKNLRLFRVVGDSKSWPFSSIPKLDAILSISRILILVRDGILQVRSKASIRKMEGDIEAYTRVMWEHLGQPFGDWSKMTDWEKWCFDWWSTYAYSDWLREQMPDTPQEIIQLEYLTQDVECLELLFASFGLSRRNVGQYQKKRVNSHLSTLTPKKVWRAWDRARRAAFERICGEAMSKLGYRVH